MKRIWIAGILILFIFIICTIGINLIYTCTNQLINEINNLYMYIDNKSYNLATQKAKKLNSNWNFYQKYYSIFIHHSDIDNISENIDKMVFLVTSKDFLKCQEICKETILKFRFILESEKISFENIM